MTNIDQLDDPRLRLESATTRDPFWLELIKNAWWRSPTKWH
jgi:hypothetical protein